MQPIIVNPVMKMRPDPGAPGSFIPSFSVLSGYFYVSLSLLAVPTVRILINFVTQQIKFWKEGGSCGNITVKNNADRFFFPKANFSFCLFVCLFFLFTSRSYYTAPWPNCCARRETNVPPLWGVLSHYMFGFIFVHNHFWSIYLSIYMSHIFRIWGSLCRLNKSVCTMGRPK